MKKIKLILLALPLVSWSCLLTAQVTTQKQDLPQGINYQAIAQGPDGGLLAETPIKVRFSLTSKDGSASIYYQEEHLTTTGVDGAFQLIVGQGEILQGQIETVPWAQSNVYLGVELALTAAEYKLVSRSQLLAVPYALVAQQTGQVIDTAAIEERNQSHIWLTSGNSDIDSDVHFLGTTDNQPLHFKTNGQDRMIINEEGRVQMVNSPMKNKNGADTDKTVYPLVIEGEKQGIWIEIEDSRTSSNNFLTFKDPAGIQGRVEGQTLSEGRSGDLYNLQVALYALKATSLTVQITGEVLQGAGYASSGYGAGVSVAAILTGTIFASELAIFIADAATWADNLANNIGVAYQTGAGDYAEYLLRDTLTRKLFPGEIIGVHHGQVSLHTDGAQHLSVVSTAPAVIGGMPPSGEEAKYEKIAFIGQVPVRVTGAVNIGDYILPSGNNDGLAIAVAPYKMRAGDYGRIIGVAWEAAPNQLLNMVNVAVGINANDLGAEVAALSLKVNKIYDFLEGKGTLSDASAINVAAIDPIEEGVTKLNKLLTDEDFDQVLDENRETFEKVFKIAQDFVEASDYNLKAIPEMQQLFDDPIAFLKTLRRDPAFFTQWSMLDREIVDQLNKSN